ncbi:hypothetical protein D3C75_554800 [compost metagenome]
MFLNPSLPQCLSTIDADLIRELETLEPTFNKHVPLRKALSDFPAPAVKLIEHMMQWVEGKHKKVLVDLKVADLKAEDYTCIPGWHIDTVTDPRHDSLPENHLIYTNVFPTEFVRDPVEFSEDKYHFVDVTDDIPKDNYISAKPNSIHKYGRFHLHRGAQVTSDCRRVLVRITETDVIHK